MDTAALKKFAQAARTTLREQVSAKLNHVLAEGSVARREAPQGVRELEAEMAGQYNIRFLQKPYPWILLVKTIRGCLDATKNNRAP